MADDSPDICRSKYADETLSTDITCFSKAPRGIICQWDEGVLQFPIIIFGIACTTSFIGEDIFREYNMYKHFAFESFTADRIFGQYPSRGNRNGGSYQLER